MPIEDIRAAANLHARKGDVPGVPSWLLFVASLIPAMIVIEVFGILVSHQVGIYLGVTVALGTFLAVNHYADYRRLQRSRLDWANQLSWVNNIEGEDAVRSALIWAEHTPDAAGVPRLNQVLADGQTIGEYLAPEKLHLLIAAITDRDNWHVLLRIADLARNDISNEGAPAGWDAYTALSFPEIVDTILRSDFDPRVINGYQAPPKPGTLSSIKESLSQPVRL